MLENGFTFTAEDRQYTIIKQLGRGANAAAYLAECKNGELTSKCILKEYSPRSSSSEDGKSRFIESGRIQNSIRGLSALSNRTPPVNRIFEANGTAYIDVACYSGITLDKLESLTLPQYMAICRTIAKTVSDYHKAGFLCLDLKPENIFVFQNSPDDTVTQLVEFIDFDSIQNISERDEKAIFSCTKGWAAPEQLNPYSAAKISTSADIYTIGEIVFFILFGRHSASAEHRNFSKYPFEECKHEYLKYTQRPAVQTLFSRIFRGTVRSCAENRFKSADDVERLLNKLVTELEQKDYVIPILPCISSNFVGRNLEMKQIAQMLRQDSVLYITGIGGIGKSTLVKGYLAGHRAEYDVIAYLEYDGDIRHTFCDDMQLLLSTVSRQDGETLDDYFKRKLTHFKRICGDKRVLFIIDNFSGRITKELSRIIDCGYDTIIASRSKPPKNSFQFMEIGAISDKTELFRLISYELERPLTKEERACFDEIISLTQGHTLVIELIAKQIAAGRLNIHTALEHIRANGFSRFCDEKIVSFKDGEEAYDTLSGIISVLFDASKMMSEERLTLKVLSLLNVRGLEAELFKKFFPEIQRETLSRLSAQGWLYDEKRIHLHPVIAETMRSMEWETDDVSVMEFHKKAVDIYVGMDNEMQLREILREADIFRANHRRHIISGIYYDMLGCLYDLLLNGAYYPENQYEAEQLAKLTAAMDTAIKETELSSDSRKEKYLTRYCISMASVLIRSSTEHFDKAAVLLKKAWEMINADNSEISDNNCYLCMALAWYYTLARPDIKKTKKLTKKAEGIARKIFPTEAEIIDIIHIPAANCYFYHNDLHSCAKKLEEAVAICKKYPDVLPYLDKQAELMCCLLDVYSEMNLTDKCRELISEIGRINEILSEHGIRKRLPPEMRDLQDH